MFIEKKKQGKSIKYYLANSYREKGVPRKIRKYLGTNLTQEEIKRKKILAEREIKNLIEELNTEVFNFSLRKSQINTLNNLNNNFKIFRLSKKDFERFTKDFVYNTNAIEGSNLLEGEVEEILEEKNKTKDPEKIEAIGVANAIDYIKSKKEELSLELIKKLHLLCFDESKSYAGKFRNVEVVIKNSSGEIVHQGVLAKHLELALKDFIAWYNKNKTKFKPIVLAAIIHNQFEYIHPFQDGNGRVGRLLLNFILLKDKYPPINIYLEDRQEYYQCLQEYQTYQNLKPTVKFLIKQYKKTLRKATTNKKKR